MGTSIEDELKEVGVRGPPIYGLGATVDCETQTEDASVEPKPSRARLGKVLTISVIIMVVFTFCGGFETRAYTYYPVSYCLFTWITSCNWPPLHMVFSYREYVATF